MPDHKTLEFAMNKWEYHAIEEGEIIGYVEQYEDLRLRHWTSSKRHILWNMCVCRLRRAVKQYKL